MSAETQYVREHPEEVVAAYAELKSTAKVGAKYKVDPGTIFTLLKKLGVKMDGHKVYQASLRQLDDATEKVLAHKYSEGGKITRLAKEFKVSVATATAAVTRAGGTLRENDRPRMQPGELEQMLDLHTQGLTQAKIAEILDRSEAFVMHALREAGRECPVRSGARHSSWKGGEYTRGTQEEGRGYVYALVQTEDPLFSMADKRGYVLKHRLVMARKLGRPLTESETVHHKDGDRANNIPDNLQLRQGKHGKGAVNCCLDCGSVNLGHQAL